MTIFDYLVKYHNMNMHQDEHGNFYLENVPYEYDELAGMVWLGENSHLMTKDVYEKYSEIEITIANDDLMDQVEYVRRPYYRMRGVPVTKEQAFDIIRRTDHFFGDEIDAIRRHDDFVGSLNFDNWLANRNHFPMGYGWIHVDGTVGGDAITQKYPKIEEFVDEWFKKLVAFPYLDLVIALTHWDELPPDVWDDDAERALFNTAAYDPQFYDAVLLGIYVHDRKIEILDKQAAVSKYKEYDRLYGSPREKFAPEYYMDRDITQIDLPYLKRCISAYGLDADEELAKAPKFAWDGSPWK